MTSILGFLPELKIATQADVELFLVVSGGTVRGRREVRVHVFHAAPRDSKTIKSLGKCSSENFIVKRFQNGQSKIYLNVIIVIITTSCVYLQKKPIALT